MRILEKEENTLLLSHLLKQFKRVLPDQRSDRIFYSSILFLAFCVYTYKIQTLMQFIGDQGWYYLSANRLITGVEFPLVGIASSHPWLHQGAFWTYLLSVALWVGGPHVLSGYYLALLFAISTLVALFKVTEQMFSKKIAFIALTLYAFSPLIILQARVPYHVTPIPFFTILFIYFLYLITKKRSSALPLSLFTLAILYNFEIAAAMLVLPLISLVLIGFMRKEIWAKQLLRIRTIVISVLAGLVPLIPFLIYDTSHGFPQTLKFVAWVGYRILLVFGFPSVGGVSEKFVLSSYLWAEGLHLQRLLFMPNMVLAVVLFFSILTIFAVIFFKKKLYKKSSYLILSLWVIFSISGYIAQRTSSDAYLPLFLSGLLIIFSIVLSYIKSKAILIGAIFILCLTNVLILMQSNYTMGQKYGSGVSLEQRERAVESIIKASGKDGYVLVGSGDGSQFKSFTMNYEYLGVSLGHPPKANGTKFHITETFNKIVVMEEK